MYDEIEAKEIKMKGQQKVVVTADDLSNRKTRGNKFVQQSEEMADNVADTMKSLENSNAVYLTATRLDLVRPMFKVSWQAILTSLTRPLQESQDPYVVELCLEGLQHAIHISCNFNMEEASIFVESLAKFTQLNNLAEIKPRNIEAIKALLHVGSTEGNYLGNAWKEVLRSITVTCQPCL